MPFGRDYEVARPSDMPAWMDEFADKELAREAAGDSPFHELRSLFQRNRALSDVEAKVRELTNRIGLDLVRGDDDSQMEKTASDSRADFAQLAEQLRRLADEYDAKGMLKEADAVDALLSMTLRAAERCVPPLSCRAMEEPEPPFAEDSKVKKIIDNIIQSRKGHVSPWAIVQQLRGEFARDMEKEQASPEDAAVVKYIKDRIDEMREDVEETADDMAGYGVGLQTSQEDVDLEDKMFEPGQRFQR